MNAANHNQTLDALEAMIDKVGLTQMTGEW